MTISKKRVAFPLQLSYYVHIQREAHKHRMIDWCMMSRLLVSHWLVGFAVAFAAAMLAI